MSLPFHLPSKSKTYSKFSIVKLPNSWFRIFCEPSLTLNRQPRPLGLTDLTLLCNELQHFRWFDPYELSYTKTDTERQVAMFPSLLVLAVKKLTRIEGQRQHLYLLANLWVTLLWCLQKLPISKRQEFVGRAQILSRLMPVLHKSSVVSKRPKSRLLCRQGQRI